MYPVKKFLSRVRSGPFCFPRIPFVVTVERQYMKFFAQGRLGHTILNLPLNDLWMLVKHSPPHDPWLKGESFVEIVKRIAKLEGRIFDAVLAEVNSIRSIKDSVL